MNAGGCVLVLAEKPSAARNFAKALGGMKGSYQGQSYEIVALRGHVLELCAPEDQVCEEKRELYRRWSLESLPWNPEDISFRKKPRKDVGGVIESLREATARATEVAIATDVDPSGEGELLAWEALEWVGWNGATTRMIFIDEAERTIQKAFLGRRELPSMESDGDYVKALARSKWDYLSMQFTRIATCVAHDRGYRTVIRQGRLKSVMVSLVGRQMDLVAGYVKKPYYEARFRDEHGCVFSRQDAAEAHRFDSPDEVDLNGLHESTVVEDSRKEKRQAPPALLDLMGMASILASYGLDSARVLAVYQKMYEDQIVSYPRTEDKTITPEQYQELLPLIDDIALIVGIDPKALMHRTPRKTHVKAGGAHGANRPGPNVPDDLESLEKYGREAPVIYRLLAKNYLAMLADDYVYMQVKGHVADFPEYVGSVNIPVKAGYKAVIDVAPLLEDDEESGVARDGFGKMASPYIAEGANKKPQRPTMKWLKARLEKYNVGTGATRVSTLDEIKGKGDPRALIDERKGVLSLTECGSISYKLLDGCLIASPAATEKLFSDMERIGRFELEPEEAIGSVAEMVVHDRAVMEANAGKLGSLEPKSATVGKCPKCGGDVVAGKRSFGCSSNKYRKNDEGKFELASGCGFAMWNTIAHKQITEKQAQALLSGKKVLMRGLKGKSGKKFEARVFLKSPEAGELGMEFPKKGR